MRVAHAPWQGTTSVLLLVSWLAQKQTKQHTHRVRNKTYIRQLDLFQKTMQSRKKPLRNKTQKFV